VFHLVLIALIALLFALTVSNFVAGGLSTLMVVSAPAVPKGAGPSEPASKRSLAVVDPGAWKAPGVGEDTAPTKEPEPVDEPIKIAEGEYPLSDLPVALNGTLVATASEYSMAMLKDTKGTATFFVGEGELFMEGVEVMRVERDRVLIKREGRVEQIDLEGAAGTGTTGAKPNKFGARPPMASSTPLTAKPVAPTDRFVSARAGITKVNDGEYRVSKNILKDVLADPTKFRDGADAKPYRKGGKFGGFELTKLRSGSMLGDIGLQQGDVITSVNGRKLNSMNVALDLYQNLSKKQDLNSMTIEVERGGKPKSLSYKVQ
jgi:general secretion pathway protein C